MKKAVTSLVRKACKKLPMKSGGGVNPDEIEIAIPKEEKFGHFSCNIAMSLAAKLKQNPRAIAESLVAQIAENDLIAEAVVAGPGFINMTLKPEAWVTASAAIAEQGERFGSLSIGAGQKMMLEFVSANPTGPLHIGHGRGAAVGDTLARILRFAGFDVATEYYINDVGLQMDNLGRSLIERTKETLGKKFEEPTYKGEYLRDTARAFLATEGNAVLNLPEEKLLTQARRFAKKDILEGIKKDLEQFAITFDNWFSEEKLHECGAVEKVIDQLTAAGVLYDKEGAVWLRSTDSGDDKDRVVKRANGVTTYLAADMAYHKNKFDRGFERLVNIWGADHHGYVPRMKAVVKALGHSPDALDVKLVQIVSLKRGGATVAMTTRGGVFVTLREIMDEVGVDATRYFFLMRSYDSQLDFDIELAKTEGDENPVYYLHYAHARCANILRKADESGVPLLPFNQIDQSLLTEPDMQILIRKMMEFPDYVAGAARTMQPHLIPQYLTELAATFHSFYTRQKVVSDDTVRSQALLALVVNVKTVLKSGLSLLGVSAPERM